MKKDAAGLWGRVRRTTQINGLRYWPDRFHGFSRASGQGRLTAAPRGYFALKSRLRARVAEGPLRIPMICSSVYRLGFMSIPFQAMDSTHSWRNLRGSGYTSGSAPASGQYEITPCKAAITAWVVVQTIHPVKYPRLPVNGIVVWPSWLPMAHEVQELLLKALANRFRGCFTKQVKSAHKTFACRAEQHRYIDPMRCRAE